MCHGWMHDEYEPLVEHRMACTFQLQPFEKERHNLVDGPRARSTFPNGGIERIISHRTLSHGINPLRTCSRKDKTDYFTNSGRVDKHLALHFFYACPEMHRGFFFNSTMFLTMSASRPTNRTS